MRIGILVVEDEPNIREAFDLVLGPSFDLRLVSSVEQALTISADEAALIKVIFLDGYLGSGLSGFHAVPLFRMQFPQASIIFTSALGLTEESVLKKSGVSMVLPKPWGIETLIEAAKQGIDLADGK